MIDYEAALEREKVKLEQLQAKQRRATRNSVVGIPVLILGILMIVSQVVQKEPIAMILLAGCLVFLAGLIMSWISFIHSGLSSAVGLSKSIGFHSLYLQIEDSKNEIYSLKRKLGKDMENKKYVYESKPEEDSMEVFNPVTELTDEQVLEIMEKAKNIPLPGVGSMQKKESGEPDSLEDLEKARDAKDLEEPGQPGKEETGLPGAQDGRTGGRESSARPEEAPPGASREENTDAGSAPKADGDDDTGSAGKSAGGLEYL